MLTLSVDINEFNVHEYYTRITNYIHGSGMIVLINDLSLVRDYKCDSDMTQLRVEFFCIAVIFWNPKRLDSIAQHT